MSDIERDARKGTHEGLERFARKVLHDGVVNIGVGDPSVDPNPAFALAEHGRIDWYGDYAAEIVIDGEYGAKQHEDQRLSHPRGGGAKFLERALAENAHLMEGIIATEVKANVTSQRRR